MKKTFLKLVICISLLTILSCESQVNIKVRCIDAQTLEPLSDVEVQVNAGLDGDYNKSTAQGKTNEKGIFEESIMIGCPGKCYDIYITYSKQGYDTRKDLNITEGDVKLHTTSWSD